MLCTTQFVIEKRNLHIGDKVIGFNNPNNPTVEGQAQGVITYVHPQSRYVTILNDKGMLESFHPTAVARVDDEETIALCFQVLTEDEVNPEEVGEGNVL